MILEEYTIDAHGASVGVSIQADDNMKRYVLDLPAVSLPTQALLDDLKKRLVAALKLGAEPVTDPALLATIHEELLGSIGRLIDRRLPGVTKANKDYLAALLMNEMTGIGKAEFLLQDPHLEEIAMQSAQKRVMVFHKRHGWLPTNVPVKDDDEVQNFASVIGRKVGRDITVLRPLLDARMMTGDRANAVLYPISNRGNSLTIRKFAREPWTFVDFIKNGTCTAEVFALIWLAVQYEMNVLFSGGTAAGKTSMLNVCMPFIPPNQRIISIEDTRELRLPDNLFWEPLVTRLPNSEGKGEVTMLDLLLNSLRMRPDRIVLGEVRRGRDALVLFEAMHTGHSVYATVHANTMNETIQRLVNPPIAVPASMLDALNLNVCMFRDRRKGIRRVFQVGEFVRSKNDVESTVRPNILYRWSAADDSIVEHGKSLTLFEDIATHTSFGMKGIEEDLAQKRRIIEWMVRKDCTGIAHVGKVMSLYYTAPGRVMAAMEKDASPTSL